jgi:hypothetical protein
MPTIRMKTESCGPKGNRRAGSVHDVSAEEGLELVQGRYAEWVEPPKEKSVEVAIKPPVENAALRTKPPSKKRP